MGYLLASEGAIAKREIDPGTIFIGKATFKWENAPEGFSWEIHYSPLEQAYKAKYKTSDTDSLWLPLDHWWWAPESRALIKAFEETQKFSEATNSRFQNIKFE